MNFRVGDQVRVIAGDDKGAQGKVIAVNRAAGKLTVEGVNRVYKHVRRSQRNPQGGRLSKEMPVSASNVMHVDPGNGEATRVGVRYREDGSKELYAKSSGALIREVSPPNERYAKTAAK